MYIYTHVGGTLLKSVLTCIEYVIYIFLYAYMLLKSVLTCIEYVIYMFCICIHALEERFDIDITYGVAVVSRIDKIIGLFCKRAL